MTKRDNGSLNSSSLKTWQDALIVLFLHPLKKVKELGNEYYQRAD